MKSTDHIAKILTQAIHEDSKSTYWCLVFCSSRKKAQQAINEINDAAEYAGTSADILFGILDRHYPVLPQCLCKAVVEAADAHKAVEVLSRQKSECSYPAAFGAGVTIVYKNGDAAADRIMANRIVHRAVENLKYAAREAQLA